MGYHEDGQMVTYDRLPLTNQISSAYGVGPGESQGSDWLATAFFAITGTLPEGPAPTMEERQRRILRRVAGATFKMPAGPTRLSSAAQLQTGTTAINDDAPPVGPKEISAALENQPGLKLNPVKVPLDYIVVDKINKVPTEN